MAGSGSFYLIIPFNMRGMGDMDERPSRIAARRRGTNQSPPAEKNIIKKAVEALDHSGFAARTRITRKSMDTDKI